MTFRPARFAEAIEDALERDGISKSELARRLNLHPAQISRYLHGKTPGLDQYIRLVHWMRGDKGSDKLPGA